MSLGITVILLFLFTIVFYSGIYIMFASGDSAIWVGGLLAAFLGAVVCALLIQGLINWKVGQPAELDLSNAGLVEIRVIDDDHPVKALILVRGGAQDGLICRVCNKDLPPVLLQKSRSAGWRWVTAVSGKLALHEYQPETGEGLAVEAGK